MKKVYLTSVSVLLAGVMSAMAGQVYDRVAVALPAVSGDKVWTNTMPNAALEIVRISFDASSLASNNIAVTRVTSDNAFTQAVCSVMLASNAGTASSFTAGYLKVGDMLAFDSTIATGSVAYIEYIVQTHE